MSKYSKKCPEIFSPPQTSKYENTGCSEFGVTLRAPVLPIEQPPNYALQGILKGCIRPTQNSNATDPQIIYNQEIQQFVKSHFLQQKNHNFFVKQVMKTMVIPLNEKHLGVYSMKNSFQNYEQFSAQRVKFKPSDQPQRPCIRRQKTTISDAFH